MKIFTTKTTYNFTDSILGWLFLSVMSYVLFMYNIDFSPLILSVLLMVYAKFLRKIERLPSYMDLSLLGALAFLICVITTITFKISGYAVSAIGLAILVTLLFENLELSLLFCLFVSFLAASVDGGNFNTGVSLFISSLSAAMLSYRVRRRAEIIKAGLYAGVLQFLVAFFMEGTQDFFILNNIDLHLFKICFANGVLSAFIVLGTLSIFEHIFKVVTNVSLLELSDFNQPLLKQLILEAPGTYQHSLVVANLSEAAAESIGVNPLLARVGAYYHDIGKLVKPDYFAENQIIYNRDAHKTLKPSMSKLIILNHVKDGIELSRKYKLNPRIVDFIQQHHGRSLIYYFYQRAKQLEPETEHEEDYRYPGPRPQNKEIAIVSLADTIEALSRTLEEPTPSRIEEMVREVVKKRFMEGELDESDLTLKEVEKITRSFVRLLNAVFHTRVNYPRNSKEESSVKSNKPKGS